MDWRFPSKTELALIFTFRSSIGGFTNGNYWSSIYNGIYNTVWVKKFGNGDEFESPEVFNNYNSHMLRAVRSF